MTRPEIIRADSIDLQDREAPSAQEHHRPAADGSFAPHQAETLREVAAGTAEERLRSPRVSWNNGDVGDLQQYAEDLAAGVTESLTSQQRGPQNQNANIIHNNNTTMHAGPQQDALAIAQNGGLSSHDVDDGDLDDTEVDMDDDMMDKISSSPSIEDGGSTFLPPSLSSHRHDAQSRPSFPGNRSASPIISDARSSSPYLDHPGHLPMCRQDQQADAIHPTFLVRHHHLSGEYLTQDSADALLPSTSHDSITTLYGDTDYHQISKKRRLLLVEVMNNDPEDDDWGPRTERYRPDSYGPNRDLSGIYHAQPYRTPSHEDETDLDYDDSELTVPYDSDEEDDDDGDFSSLDDPRFIDSGWGGECLQDTEDIDFELVYALHTFVATVDGQANATKGDAMVLLDDSNSYWWLVRVVKDASIGYLPAEHIETPTERLARLNKHRNIDLSATMLGDQAEKSRNPLKSAIKRRKTKTVQFVEGRQETTYELDYSTEEEDLEAEYFIQQQQQQGQQAQEAASQQATTEQETEDETAKVEPLRPRGQQKETKGDSKKRENGEPELANGVSRSRDSEEIFETKAGDGPKKTSDGTVRDSFFKDDTGETKKITLTPNLLRDDNAPRSSSDSKELKQRPSLDKLEKDSVLGKDDKKKKDKKEKDKKPGSIRSFFSRKDKKTKDEDDDSFGKRSMDVDVQESQVEEEAAQASPERAPGVQRNPSKLQKQQPRTEPSPTRKPNGDGRKESGLDVQAFLAEGKLNNVSNVPPASMRVVDSDSPRGSPPRDRSLNPNAGAAKTPAGDYQPAQATKAKSRVELDDFDSDEDIGAEAVQQVSGPVKTAAGQQRSVQSSYPDSSQQAPQKVVGAQTAKPTITAVNTTPPQQHKERLSESPVHISPVSPVNAANPPPLVGDTSSQEEDRSSLRSSPSPELIEHDDDEEMANKKDSMTTTTSTAAMSWNDVSLRAFFDSGTEIRDMLVVVYDKSDVAPAGPEHPVAGTLFKEPKAALAEITTQLDNMLGDWLARKQRSRGTL